MTPEQLAALGKLVPPVEKEPAEKLEDGDIFNEAGDHIGHMDVPKHAIDLVLMEVNIFHGDQMYVFKFDYRTPAEVDNHAEG